MPFFVVVLEVPQAHSRVNMPSSYKRRAADIQAKANRVGRDSEIEKSLVTSLDVSIAESKRRIEIYDSERVESWADLRAVAARKQEEEEELKRLEEVIEN